MRPHLLGPALLSAALAGCPTTETEPAPVSTRTAVITSVSLQREDAGLSLGFDLDGRVSGEDDNGGCGVEDFTHPDGTPGIDNGMAPILPLLDVTEAVALEPILQESINNGALLILLEMSGLDDLQQDEEVALRVLRGQGEPLVGAHGRLVSGQTFELDPAVPPSESIGSIDGGELVAHGFELTLPFTFIDFDAVLGVDQASARVSLSEDGVVQGVIAGALDWRPLQAALEDSGVDNGVVALLGDLFDENADLGADCEDISIVMSFAGVSAFVYED